MSYDFLYAFVEGDDDEDFFNQVIYPRLILKYDYIQIVKYAEFTKEEMDDYLNSVSSMKADFFLLHDHDIVGKTILEREQEISVKYSVDQDRVGIVQMEIESWYIAGLIDSKYPKCGLKKCFRCTDDVTKEKIKQIKPKKYPKIKDFLLDMLNYYSLDIAIKKNASIKYFIEKFDIL